MFNDGNDNSQPVQQVAEDNTLTKLKNFLSKSSNILIFSHLDPDRDTLASNFALNDLLALNLGLKPISIVFGKVESGVISPKYGEYHIFDRDIKSSNTVQEKIKELINNCDIVILVDVANLSRALPKFFLQEVGDTLKNKKIIVFDHHPNNRSLNYTPIVYVNKQKSSTTELIWEFFVNKLKFKVNKNIAKNLLLGILADTRNFRYVIDVSKQFFKNVSQIVRFLTPVEYLNLCQIATEHLAIKYIKTYQKVLDNVIFYNDIALAYIDYPDLPNIKGYEDYMQFILYIIHKFLDSLVDINLTIFVYPDFGPIKDVNEQANKVFRVSLRTHAVAKYKVQELAQQLGGGGRMFMGGAKLYGKTVKEVVNKITAVLGFGG